MAFNRLWGMKVVKERGTDMILKFSRLNSGKIGGFHASGILYSARSASIGLTRVARRAGSQLEKSPIMMRRIETAAKLTGS